MATAKKKAKRSSAGKKNIRSKAVSKKAPVKRSKSAAPKKAAKPALGPIFRTRRTVYIDSSFFFPPDNTEGYTDDSQAGRYTTMLNGILQAPVILPVGATLTAVSVYYKNTSTEAMPVAILKKSIDHYCFSGEVEVSLDNCPPGTSSPDNYLAKLINHFADGGVILDNYLYFIQIYSTGKVDEAQWRTVRGMRIDYVY